MGLAINPSSWEISVEHEVALCGCRMLLILSPQLPGTHLMENGILQILGASSLAALRHEADLEQGDRMYRFGPT